MAIGVSPVSLPKRILSSIDAMLFPRRCVVCRSFIQPAQKRQGDISAGPHTRDDLASFLCPDCHGGCRPMESPLCRCCGRMFSGRVFEDHLCGECITQPKPFHRMRAWGVYDGALLKVVHCFKYHHKQYLARPLGKHLYAAFRQNWGPGEIDVVIPVPLHPGKLRQRGFNQSQLLVRQWPCDPVGTGFPPLATDWLVRIRRTRSQAGLKKNDRLDNIRDAFALRGRPPLTSKSVLLVDDVYTTGATVTECARVLLTGGARRIDVLTLARAL